MPEPEAQAERETVTARRRRTAQGPVGLVRLRSTVSAVLVVFDTLMDAFGGSLFYRSLPFRYLSPQNAGREYQSNDTHMKSRKFPSSCEIQRPPALRRMTASPSGCYAPHMTPASTRRAQTVEYTVDGAPFASLVVRPATAEPRPAVLVCHTWGGRDGFTDERAGRLADLGYVGVAVDLYGVGRRGYDKASSSALMTELVTNPPLLRSRLQAVFELARGLDGVDSERIGAIGFCFGGLCAILCARMGLHMRGVVSFHGLLKVGEPLPAPVRARILVLHGQDDPMAPPADVGLFAAEMKRINADWQFCAYPGVVHAFTNPNADDPSVNRSPPWSNSSAT